MAASPKFLIGAAIALCGGPALAESPLGIATPAQIVAAAQACAHNLTADAVNETRIEFEGWLAIDPKKWDRPLRPEAKLFSKGDGVLLMTITAKADAGCIVYARLPKGQTVVDAESGLTAAFGKAPVYRSDATHIFWASQGFMFLLSPDRSEPDVLNITILPQRTSVPPKGDGAAPAPSGSE